MKAIKISKGVIIAFFINVIPTLVFAERDISLPEIRITLKSSLVTDTIPSTNKPKENPTDKPATAIIKEVPKPRKLQVPVPVSIKVQPIIKPKIIKPVIKIVR